MKDKGVPEDKKTCISILNYYLEEITRRQQKIKDRNLIDKKLELTKHFKDKRAEYKNIKDLLDWYR